MSEANLPELLEDVSDKVNAKLRGKLKAILKDSLSEGFRGTHQSNVVRLGAALSIAALLLSITTLPAVITTAI